jgi:uncharacterized membrane protein
VSFATITLYVASQRVFIIVSVYFVIDSIRKLLDTLSYASTLIQKPVRAKICCDFRELASDWEQVQENCGY